MQIIVNLWNIFKKNSVEDFYILFTQTYQFLTLPHLPDHSFSLLSRFSPSSLFFSVLPLFMFLMIYVHALIFSGSFEIKCKHPLYLLHHYVFPKINTIILHIHRTVIEIRKLNINRNCSSCYNFVSYFGNILCSSAPSYPAPV